MECDSKVLSLLLTDDEEIAQLNSQYRGKEGPTDVLSFAMQEGECFDAGSEILGDVVISVETMFRQAESIGHRPEDEFLRLLIHGVLHLLGYDHENVPESEAERMREKEEEHWRLLWPLLPRVAPLDA